MDVHNDKASSDNSYAFSSLNVSEQCLHSKPENILDRDSNQKGSINERNCESNVICKISSVSELINNDSCKVKDNENSTCDHGSNNYKDEESNLVQQGPYDEDSKSSKFEVSDKLLKDFEYNSVLKNSPKNNKNQDIFRNSIEEIQDNDISINSENDKSVLLEDEENINNLKKNNKAEIESPLCRDVTKIKTSEKPPGHQIVEELAISYASATPMPVLLDVLDKNISSDGNVSKYQSRDTRESIYINVASRENIDKNIVSTFEADNIESSDTSALMKLAELACETNDTVASEILKSYDNTLKVNETDSADKQNSETICNLDETALEMENDEILNSNSKSEKEFGDKNTSDTVKGLTLEKISVASNENNPLSKSNDSYDKDSKGDNTKILSSESETEALVTENLEEEKVNSSAREAENSTQVSGNVDQNILNNFHTPNETDEKTNINLKKFAGKESLLTENVCSLPQNCKSLNIVVDQNICVRHSDINEANINLEQQKNIKLPQSKLNLGDNAKNEQKGKLSSLRKQTDNENLKEINSFPESEDLVIYSKICIEKSNKSNINESNISGESPTQSNNETILLSHNDDPSEQPDSFRMENNHKIDHNSVFDDKLYLPDTHCIDVGKNKFVSHVYCEKQETNRVLDSKVNSEERNKGIKNNCNSSKENMPHTLVKETFSHSLANVLDQKSVMEQQNSHSSVMEEISHFSVIKKNLEENTHSSRTKNSLEKISHTSRVKNSLEENSNSLQMKNNLEENSKDRLQENSHSSTMKSSLEEILHTSKMKSTLEENSNSLETKNILKKNSKNSLNENSHSLAVKNYFEENSLTSGKKNSLEENSHSLLMKNNLEGNSDSSGVSDSLEENLHSSEIKNNSEEKSDSSGMKTSLEKNSHSSETRNNLCSSVKDDRSQTSLIKETPTHESNKKCTSNTDIPVVSNISPTFPKESTLQSTSTECSLRLALTETNNTSSSETNNNSQNLVDESMSHSLETKNSLKSSVMENSHSSDIENNFSPPVIENNSHSLEVENNFHPPVKENGSHYSEKEINLNPSVKENGLFSSDVEHNFHPSLKENDSHSSEEENNLHNSVIENDSHSLVKENNVPYVIKAKLYSSELETNAHSLMTKNILHSISDENSDSSVNMPVKEHTQIVSNSSSSCPKIYIRKDLHEGYSYDDSESIKNSLNEKINSTTVTDISETSIKLTENNVKRALSVTDKSDENCSKRLCGVLDLTCSEESSDDDKLIIDEERTNLKYRDSFTKHKNPKGKDYKNRSTKPNSTLESLLKVKNQKPGIHCSADAKSEIKSLPVSNISNLKPMVEVVDLVGDELKEDSINKSVMKINNDKNFICEKCKNIWNDKTLKLLFEGNESVTVNSRITYGAIICMNIYVSIHYPKIKEQALLGLLDRADLAKNLGSIQVSLLNNWLVALIKNKKISCCDPFRPVYRAKTPNQAHRSDNMQTGNKEIDDKQRQSSESSVKVKNLSTASINQSNSTAEILIDDDNDLNQEHEERNLHYIDSGISLASGKYHAKKVDSCLKHGSTVIDSKGGVITNGKAFTKQFAKSNPISYSIIQREKESLSSDLHDAYNKLVYESKLTEEEAITGKRKILTNKEILCMHSIFILNAKEILLDKYYRFLFQLLYHRGNILLIPDEKSLVQRIENIRKERNRMKFSVAKNKTFLSQSWDIDNICTAPIAKSVNKKNEFNVKVQDILSVFCSWKNRKLLNGNTYTNDLREEVLKLYENKIEINDCFGLCIKLYANYSRLLFSQNETENMKTKVFLSLYYLPNKYLSSLENTLIFDPEITYFPPTNGNSSDIIDYLEKQTNKGNGPVKRSYLDSVIDAKLQQAKKLKTDLLNSVKTPKTISLIESYAKLKNEMNYLEVEPANHQSFKSAEDSQEENLIKSLTYTPEVKLMVAKLRASNVDSEYIPIILEKVFHNILKRKIPTL